MLINVNDLTGPALDWAVAKALGLNPNMDPEARRQYVGYEGFAEANGFGYPIKSYHNSWDHSGPIIEQGLIVLSPHPAQGWFARSYMDTIEYLGDTPLIAAMCCYVASVLGDVVEIPNGLISK